MDASITALQQTWLTAKAMHEQWLQVAVSAHKTIEQQSIAKANLVTDISFYERRLKAPIPTSDVQELHDATSTLWENEDTLKELYQEGRKLLSRYEALAYDDAYRPVSKKSQDAISKVLDGQQLDPESLDVTHFKDGAAMDGVIQQLTQRQTVLRRGLDALGATLEEF